MFDLGYGIQECTKSSILNAIREGRHLIELDVAMTSDGVFIACHDFTPWRVAEVEEKTVREFHSSEIVGQPVIIREIVEGIVSDNDVVSTQDTICTIEDILNTAFAENPNITFFLDVREDEFHPFVSWISYFPQYLENVVVIFYTFKYRNPNSITAIIDNEGPADGWKEKVAIMPMIFPEELPRLAREQDRDPDDEDDLFAAGETWIDAVAQQGFRLIALQTVFTDVSYIQLDPGSAAQGAFKENQASARLASYVREGNYLKGMYPNLKLVNLTRSYDYSAKIDGVRRYFNYKFREGREKEWESHEQKFIKRGYATPGNKNCDIITSDRSEDDMAWLTWYAYGTAYGTNFNAPHLNIA
ncbi:agrocinopine synthase [Agrobacterium vitis]|uniref:glycerophosphodiester phosphodiesterase family protein n=1 Tax=Allorhizobium ampelinum TaxID=3025782 RepID=UPI001F2D871F|nr:glycerophosphodiester phosphodiesterase family protein [Allorhizobium ampelinum]MCF1450784.1 agrocinopine synthase [Allorhizobium ampelinum]